MTTNEDATINQLRSMEPRTIIAVDADGTRREVVRVPLRDHYCATTEEEL